MLKIVLAPDPVLRIVCDPLAQVDSHHQKLIKEMFETMEKFSKHSGSHELWEINRRLENQFGTVRCGKCFRSFATVEVMSKHACTTVSPVSSSGSLDSILIHDSY